MRCIKCGEERESEFSPSRLKIRDYRCRFCVREYSNQWRQANPGHGRAYMRSHLEAGRKNQHKWYENNKELHYKRRLASAQANPQRHNAQSMAFWLYPEAQVCEKAECSELGERHHDDYSKPRKVRWLCRKHHKELSRIYA